MLKLFYYQKTDRGKIREINEDSLAAILPENDDERLSKGSVFVVADGLGGLADGEVASREAVRTFEELFKRSQNPLTVADIKKIFDVINAGIFKINSPKMSDQWMATTLTASYFYKNKVSVGHVGDCRMYQVRRKKIGCLTKDHSAGRHILTRAIGTHPMVQTDVYETAILPEDVYVQCSDGLYSMMDDRQIQDCVVKNDPQKSCENLVALANKQGGHDNITVQVIEIHD